MDKEATASVSAGARSGRAVLMLLLATLYWGVSFPVIKTLVEVCHRLLPEAGTWYLTAATVAPRFLLATLFMVLVRPRGAAWPTRSEVRQGLGIGIVAAIGTLLQTDGMQFTEASTSSFLTQFSAILIPVSLAVRNRRNPGAVVWLSCALVLAGVAILGHFNWRTFHFGRGEWETLLCSLFFSGQILWVGKKEFAGNRPDAVALVMFACQAAAFLGMALCTAPDARALGLPWLSPAWLGLSLVLTLVCTVAAFTIMTRWQPLISSTEAGIIYCAEPVFASVFSLFMPALYSGWAHVAYANETATLSLVAGGGLITLANILVQVMPVRESA